MNYCLFFLLAAALQLAAESASPALDTRKVLTVRADQVSGRLVRSVVVQPRVIRPAEVKPAPTDRTFGPGLPLSQDTVVNEIVEEAAKRHNVDPLLVHSVIQVESGYNKYAVSPKGAQGLMQLIPATAHRFGVRNAFDPKQNIEAGVRYLRQLQDMFGDDRLALAAYNAGENAVTRYRWIPPYAETQDYVYKVGARYGAARRAAERTKQQAAAAPEKPKRVQETVDGEGRVHLQLQ